MDDSHAFNKFVFLTRLGIICSNIFFLYEFKYEDLLHLEPEL